MQSLSRVRLFVTLWTAARQAPLSITNSRSLLKLMSIESVMPSTHLTLCRPLLLLPLYTLYLSVNAYGEGNGTPFQYSCLENPMDGGAWRAAVHGVTKSRIRLSDFTFTFHFHALEKEMATHSRILAWRIPGTGEPGGLPSMGSHRVGHD